MKILNRNIDIELTNRCNATCDFCPREKTPKQGFMSMAVFDQVIDRVLALGGHNKATLTGLGEPMLHPQFLEFVAHGIRRGLHVDIVSNGSRLTPTLSAGLLDAGLKTIVFSVSDIDDAYDKVYGLPFSVTRDNIVDFIQQSRGRCHVQITVVRHDGNVGQIDDIVSFWQTRGADYVHVVREENRGGSHEKSFQFLRNKTHWQEAVDILHHKQLTTLCAIAFYSVFIGWNGMYYLCCQDWEKTMPIGNVYDLSIEDIDATKLTLNRQQKGICRVCSMNPINELREVLFEIEQGKRGKFAIGNKVKNLCTGAQRLSEFTQVLAAEGVDPTCDTQVIAMTDNFVASSAAVVEQ
ncbi:MAG: radical SAM protein [Pseudomonadales bacterium]|nr:radical SAM protein [Pseudomonadales bacterium]